MPPSAHIACWHPEHSMASAVLPGGAKASHPGCSCLCCFLRGTERAAKAQHLLIGYQSNTGLHGAALLSNWAAFHQLCLSLFPQALCMSASRRAALPPVSQHLWQQCKLGCELRGAKLLPLSQGKGMPSSPPSPTSQPPPGAQSSLKPTRTGHTYEGLCLKSQPCMRRGVNAVCSCGSAQSLLLLFLAFFLSASCILKTQSHIGQRQTSALRNYSSLILSQKSKGQTEDDKHSKEALILFLAKQCCREPGCATQIENNTLTHSGWPQLHCCLLYGHMQRTGRCLPQKITLITHPGPALPPPPFHCSLAPKATK